MNRLPHLPLNPLDRSPAPRDGVPVIGGRFPKVGHLPALAWDMPLFLSWAKRNYGPCAWVDRGFGSHILQLAGDASFEVLRNKHTNSSALHDVAATFLGHSMIVVDGAEHRRVRGAASHAFTPAGLNRAKVGSIVEQVIDERLVHWPHMDTLPIARETRELALAVIFRMIGIPPADLPEWRHQFEELALSAVNLPWDFPGSPVRRGRNAKTWLDARVRSIVSQTRRDNDKTSLVGAMVHGRDDAGQGLSDAELVDNIKLLVLAGHETTATVLAWAMLHLAESPECWDRLCDEANGLENQVTATTDFHCAPYATGVFREALRLYPPVANTIRKVNETLTFAGHTLPADTVVACNLHEISRDATRYPEPNKFLPARWLSRPPRPTPLETCQFGGGPHFCLGYHVAMLEGVALLVSAAQRLSAANKRPALLGQFPRARYIPLIHPPRNASVKLVAA